MGDRSTGEYRYGSAGAGLRWKYVAADAAYLLAGSSSPLRNTWILSVLFSAFPAVGHIPERMDSFQVAVLFLNRFLVESLGKLQCALHDDITCF